MATAIRTGRRLLPAQPGTRPPLSRLFWIMARLRSGRPLKAPDVAANFETSVRTSHRDFEFLRDRWGVPLEFDRQRLTWVLTEPTFSLPLVTLSRGELLALYFAEKVLRQYRGTPYEADLKSAFRKLQEFLPEEVSVDPNPIEEFLSLDLGRLVNPDAGTFRAVVAALQRRRRLAIRYTSLSRGKTEDRTVDPYHVYNLRGTWYIAAFDKKRKAVRDFALHRIRSAQELPESYTIDRSFRFAKYMADSFGIEKGSRPVTVAIRFGPRQARWTRERRWHPTQRIQERLDGGCILRMKVAGLDEVKRWVMQFGEEAEVLAPHRLRRDVITSLDRARSLYRAGAASLKRSADAVR
jgi:predicted DNA-binding transcriptional regulator YafY